MRRVCSVAALLAVTITGCSGGGLKHKPSLSGETTTLNLGLPKQALDAPVTGNVPGNQMLHVDLVLKVSDATLKQLGQKYQKAAKGGGGVDLKKQLGISDADMKKIQDYFAGANIQVKPSKTNTAVTFDVKASDAAALLQTSFVNHKLNGRTFFTPDPAHMPKIPKEIADYILAVTGLDSYSVTPKRGSSAVAPKALPAKDGGCIDLNGLDGGQSAGPARVARAYGIDRLHQQGWQGQGMTVNLVEMDGYNSSDIQTYLQCIRAGTQIDTVRLGTDPKPFGETILDMSMVASLAPKAHIIDYQMDGDSQGTGGGWWTAFNAALQAIVDANSSHPDTGSVVSISLGGAENAMSQDVLQSVNENLRILTQAEHMTVFLASMDCGAFADAAFGDGGQWGGTPNVAFPADSPYVVGVGGTRMSFSGSRVGETTWSDKSDTSKCDNKWGSGGGVSTAFQRPDYQQGPGTNFQYTNGNREMPDVAATGINLPIYNNNEWESWYGTSAATPIWAAGMSLLNEGLMQRTGGFYSGPETLYWVYNHAAGKTPFHDVTTGDNGYYHAGRGWDATTGLGTPSFPAIYDILAAAAKNGG